VTDKYTNRTSGPEFEDLLNMLWDKGFTGAYLRGGEVPPRLLTKDVPSRYFTREVPKRMFTVEVPR
jgi:hypothetical protein